MSDGLVENRCVLCGHIDAVHLASRAGLFAGPCSMRHCKHKCDGFSADVALSSPVKEAAESALAPPLDEHTEPPGDDSGTAGSSVHAAEDSSGKWGPSQREAATCSSPGAG